MNLKNNLKTITFWVLAGVCLLAFFSIYQGVFKKDQLILPLSDFITQIDAGQIEKVLIREQDLQVMNKSGQQFTVVLPRFFDPMSLLMNKNVKFTAATHDANSLSVFLSLIQILLPVILFWAIWYFFFRQVQNSNGRTLGFGRSRAKLSDPQKNTITFKDVEGVEEAKEDLKEVVDFLKYPERFEEIGGAIPKGILLVGPPGTGKTLLARAVAGEAKVPFFSISGSDFVEMFVGVGASRVRDLFTQAKQQAPCIIFIDEIDAVGRNRGVGMGGGHDEREQTLNQLLVEMDGFDPKQEVIIIAATNRADVLDPALLRPGRFDRRVSVDLPDLRGREAILKVHLQKIRFSDEVSPLKIAKGTPGFSGADLANLVNESALRAARLSKKVADPEDFDVSRDKLIMGPERRTLLLTEDDKKLTAYHEAGHAVVAYHSPHSDPIHKATIIPRGGALGMVVRLPEGDQVSMSRQRLLDDLAVAMAGRVSEEIIFGHPNVTTGASSDFRFATNIARKMVLEWGMSDAVGLISYAMPESTMFFGESGTKYSQEVLKLIDEEVKKILDAAVAQASLILTTHRDHLEMIAKSLLEYETLTGEEIDSLLKEGKLNREKAPELLAQEDSPPGAVEEEEQSSDSASESPSKEVVS